VEGGKLKPSKPFRNFYPKKIKKKKEKKKRFNWRKRVSKRTGHALCILNAVLIYTRTHTHLPPKKQTGSYI